MTIHITPNNPQYRIVEIFEDLQDGGWNIGMPAVFVRLGKCNLACNWCDTDYPKLGMMSLSDILGYLKIYTTRNIIIAGGEPTIQPHLDTLLNVSKVEGYFPYIETNGLNPTSPQIDYVAISPRAYYATRYDRSCIEEADGVCIVTDGEVIAFCRKMECRARARHYCLSSYEQDGAMSIYDTTHQIGMLSSRVDAPVRQQLGIQTHKWVETGQFA